MTLELTNSEVVISNDFFVSHSIRIDQVDKIRFKSMDQDGFISFEIHYVEPKKIIVSPQLEAEINGYTLFHSRAPTTTAYGTQKSLYEYYKRDRDLSYYVLIRRGNSKPQKILLGSLLESKGIIFPMAWIINRSFDKGEVFDRKKMVPFLPSKFRNRRIMKAVLDVLTAEGFLKRIETKSRGRLHEEFTKTEKLEKFMLDRRSSLKPSGVDLGKVTVTSDR